MIIMISGTVLGGPGPGPKPARKKAGRRSDSPRRESDGAAGGAETGVPEMSQQDPGPAEQSGPAPPGFWLQTPGNFGMRVKPY